MTSLALMRSHPSDEFLVHDGGDVTANDEGRLVFDYGVDSIGRRYPRDIYGNRIIPGNPRPEDFPRETSNKLTKKQEEEFIELYKKTKTTSPATEDDPGSTKPSGLDGAPRSGASITLSESKLLPCESYVDQWLTTLCSPSTIGGVVAATITPVDQHRDKVGFPLIPYVCTCRPVDRKEIEEDPKAKQAMQSEWDRLRSRKAWDESNPREWSDVAREGQTRLK